MKIQYISDLHLDYWKYYHNESIESFVRDFESTLETECDILIVAGDISSKGRGMDYINAIAHFFKLVVVIAGNHDYWNRDFPNIEFKTPPASNVKYLCSEYFVYQEIVFVGAVLWTDFFDHNSFSMWNAKNVMNDYKHMRRNNYKHRVDANDIYAQHIKDKAVIELANSYAKENGFELVVVTHHAPSEKSVSPYYVGNESNAYYYSDLDDLVEKCECNWIHGHIHYPTRYSIGNSTVHCNPRGYSNQECGGMKQAFFEI